MKFTGMTPANDLNKMSAGNPRRLITYLLTGATFLLVFLLAFMIVECGKAFQNAADTEHSLSLMVRCLYVHHATSPTLIPAPRVEDWRNDFNEIERIRGDLRQRYPVTVAQTDRPFAAFARSLQQSDTVDWKTTEALQDALGKLAGDVKRETRRQIDITLSVCVFVILWFLFTLSLGLAFLVQFRRTQQKLAESNAEHEVAARRLTALLINMPVACYSFDSNGTILLWNRSAETVFGRSAESVIGKPVWAILAHPSEYGQEKEMIRRVVSGEEMPNREWEFAPPGGKARMLLTTTFPLRNENSQIIGGVSATVDITERKEAEARLGSIIEGARCIVWDAQVEALPEEQEFIWYSRLWNEATAQSVLPLDTTDQDYISAWVESRPEDQPRLHQTSSAALREGCGSYSQEFSCRDRYGVEHYLTEHVRIEPQSPGRWHVTGISTDITERKRMEERLEEVLAGARCILWEADVRRDSVGFHWDFHIWNKETAQKLIPLDDTEEKYEWAWDKSRLPEDRLQIDNRAREAIESGEAGYQQEFRCRDCFGNIRWISEDALIKPQSDGSWQIIGFCREITPRKIAEERLNSVLDKARCILWDATVTETDNRLVWALHVCNESSAQTIIPLDTSDKYYSLAWSDSRHSEDTPRVNATGMAAIREGKTGYTHEFRCRDMHNKLHWLHEEAIIQPLASGRWRIIGVCTDVTERKAAEERLRALTEELSRSNTALQDFASIASHDLKEPLRKIQTFGNMLTRKADNLSPDALGYLERMIAASTRMQALIDGLLSYSRVTSKGSAFVATDLNEVVKGVLADLEVRISDANAIIKVNPLPTIQADALQMRQLFQNLIGNALKFHHPDHPTRVCIDYQFVEGKHIISVTDNGIGFSIKDAERIFEVFERLDSSAYEGTGIGLSICRKIVERHRGTIVATGAPGNGAQFTITLG